MRTRTPVLALALALAWTCAAHAQQEGTTKVYPENMALVGVKIGSALNTVGWSKEFGAMADKTIDAWAAAEKRGTTSKNEWTNYDKGKRPLLDFMPDAWGQFKQLDGKRVVSERTIRVDPANNTAVVSAMEFDGRYSKGIVLTPTRWTHLTVSPGRALLLQREQRNGATVERQLEGRQTGRLFNKPVVLERRQRTVDQGAKHQGKVGYRLRIGSRAFIPLPKAVGLRIERRLDRRISAARNAGR